MQKLTLSLLALVLTLGLSAQTWSGNNPTFTTGTYDADYTGTATIIGNVIFTGKSKSSLAAVDIKSGATLTLQDGEEFYNGFTIEPGGSLIANDDITLDQTVNIAGNLLVSENLSVNNGTVTLSGCGYVKTENLSIHNDNLFAGAGLIYITGNYNSEHDNYHPLTASNKIYVTYSGDWKGFGSAQKSTQTVPSCSVVTPVTLINWAAKATDNVVTFTWTTTIESNVQYFRIDGSVDGGASGWDSLATIGSLVGGTHSGNVDYSVTYVDPLIPIVKTACISCLGIVFLLGLGFGMVKNRRLGMALSVLLVVGAFTACSKNTVGSQPVAPKYKTFRLVEVDLDGRNNVYQTIIKPVN